MPPEFVAKAYPNQPLPIGCGQTIAQPFIAAMMADRLAPKGSDIVRQSGAGSGDRAAALAGCAEHGATIDIVKLPGALVCAQQAQQNLLAYYPRHRPPHERAAQFAHAPRTARARWSTASKREGDVAGAA